MYQGIVKHIFYYRKVNKKEKYVINMICHINIGLVRKSAIQSFGHHYVYGCRNFKNWFPNILTVNKLSLKFTCFNLFLFYK